MCENKQCRKKFREYIEQNSRQFEEIYSLENDIREKETFVQKIVKARNNFQEESALLKVKNLKLLKDLDDLTEKADQFEEDAVDGVEMVRRAHERERKSESKLNELR